MEDDLRSLYSPDTYDLFVQCLEDMRRRFAMCSGYEVMQANLRPANLTQEPAPCENLTRTPVNEFVAICL